MRSNQQHSCKNIPLDEHFKNKGKAKELFTFLFTEVNRSVGACTIISLPCCIHLFGTYDFMAVLPRKDKLELHFELGHTLENPRIKQTAAASARVFLNSLEITTVQDVDKELLNWLKDSYHFKQVRNSRPAHV